MYWCKGKSSYRRPCQLDQKASQIRKFIDVGQSRIICQLHSQRSTRTPAIQRCCPQTSSFDNLTRKGAVGRDDHGAWCSCSSTEGLGDDGGGSFGKFVASSFPMADNRNFTSNRSLLVSCTTMDISSSVDSSSASINVRIWLLSVVTFSSCSRSASFYRSISFLMSSV